MVNSEQAPFIHPDTIFHSILRHSLASYIQSGRVYWRVNRHHHYLLGQNNLSAMCVFFFVLFLPCSDEVLLATALCASPCQSQFLQLWLYLFWISKWPAASRWLWTDHQSNLCLYLRIWDTFTKQHYALPGQHFNQLRKPHCSNTGCRRICMSHWAMKWQFVAQDSRLECRATTERYF